MARRGTSNRAIKSIEACFLRLRGEKSIDELIIDDDLNAQFIDCVQADLPELDPATINWALLNLRKRGAPHLGGSRRRFIRHEAYQHAAEIAARHMEDKLSQTLDRVLCDPLLRREFDAIATSIAPDVPRTDLRRAALNLRKSRRLRPEIAKRIIHPKVTVHSAKNVVEDPSLLPDGPGIYLLRDKTGVLYLGEASRLRRRVLTHLDHSDRKSLARYLWDTGARNLDVECHIFDPDGPGAQITVRRAYEAELIKSRGPRFNLQGI